MATKFHAINNVVTVIKSKSSSFTLRMTNFNGKSKELKPVLTIARGKRGRQRSVYIDELQFITDNVQTFREAFSAFNESAEKAASPVVAGLDPSKLAQLIALLQGMPPSTATQSHVDRQPLLWTHREDLETSEPVGVTYSNIEAFVASEPMDQRNEVVCLLATVDGVEVSAVATAERRGLLVAIEETAERVHELALTRPVAIRNAVYAVVHAMEEPMSFTGMGCDDGIPPWFEFVAERQWDEE